VSSQEQITEFLRQWSDGDQTALEKLAPLVYGELHRLARRHMAREKHGLTLQTSALVNEAYVRLIDAKGVKWRDRAHFFGISSRLMRQILVDFARDRKSLKRGGDVVKVTLTGIELQDESRSTDLLALDEALSALSQLDPRQSQVVELRFFGGLSLEETAEVLDVSVGTVRRDWRLARAWLYRELMIGS